MEAAAAADAAASKLVSSSPVKQQQVPPNKFVAYHDDSSSSNDDTTEMQKVDKKEQSCEPVLANCLTPQRKCNVIQLPFQTTNVMSCVSPTRNDYLCHFP